MSAIPHQKMTPAEYLAFERSSEERHEYLDGEIFLMSGGSPKHSQIAISLSFFVYGQLRQKPCTVYNSDQRVQVSNTGLYTYPDLSIVCGDPQFDEDGDNLLNPTVLIEVLSPTTESYDRGKKFQHYRTLASLQEYVLIGQDSPRIERYTRQPDNQWLLADAAGLEARIELVSIGCTLALADVYEKVTFD
jgi:Uma2 family endonuclease